MLELETYVEVTNEDEMLFAEEGLVVNIGDYDGLNIYTVYFSHLEVDEVFVRDDLKVIPDELAI